MDSEIKRIKVTLDNIITELKTHYNKFDIFLDQDKTYMKLLQKIIVTNT